MPLIVISRSKNKKEKQGGFCFVFRDTCAGDEGTRTLRYMKGRATYNNGQKNFLTYIFVYCATNMLYFSCLQPEITMLPLPLPAGFWLSLDLTFPSPFGFAL